MPRPEPPAPPPVARRVLLAGVTGLVGQQLLRALLAEPMVAEVRAVTRRPVTLAQLLDEAAPPAGADKLRLCQIDFERLEQHVDLFQVDWVCCALGTTLRKAGSQAAFRQVDFCYPLQIAQLARAQGARQLLLVSAVGANASSRVFYNRVKGELEEALGELGFESVCVAQPSLLAGDRSEFRLGERLALLLSGLMPSRYKPVQAAQVALGLLSVARTERPGWHVLSNTVLRGMR